MIMTSNSVVRRQVTWQEQFVAMLPEIERLLRISFRNLAPEARVDAHEEGVVHCLLSYVRLFEQGRAEVATPSSLAWFAKLQVRRGRTPACPMTCREPLSRYGQLGKGIRVVRLHHGDFSDDTWINDVIDSGSTSISDRVATKLDFVAWLGSLCQRTRRIAMDLARGNGTRDVAQKYRLSPGRISQLRRELHNSWQLFQGEPSLLEPR
ncbi:MAG: hypothetical protein SGJ20_05030 [Planctomycetota bacterium]|nr:hypothetical protein [Planctomycetota bacterium]